MAEDAELISKFPVLMRDYISGDIISITSLTGKMYESHAQGPLTETKPKTPRFPSKPEMGSIVEVEEDGQKRYFEVAKTKVPAYETRFGKDFFAKAVQKPDNFNELIPQGKVVIVRQSCKNKDCIKTPSLLKLLLS